MKWNGKASIAFSQLCVILFTIVAISICTTAPWLTEWFIHISRAQIQHSQGLFLTTIYSAAVFLFPILWFLWRLLCNIAKENVFVFKNVGYLRKISWCCFAVAVICFCSTTYYLPYLFLAAVAAFMALIVRVVKNVLQQAVKIKEEADYTI